ncbi:MAG: CcdB family protein [Pseudomonadota bacterium]
MQKFDIFEIGSDLFMVVQSDHLLELNTVVLVPVIASERSPALSKLTVDLVINDQPFRVRTHMPLTVEANRLRGLKPVHRATQDEGQRIMDGMSTLLWGF